MNGRALVVLAFAAIPAFASAQARPPAVAPARTAARVVVVVTSEGALAEFGDPCASRAGWVVFHATRDDHREGIYLSTGGAPFPLAESGSAVPDGAQAWHFQGFGRAPTVNDTSTCAFTARFTEGGSAVMASDGIPGSYRFVADSGEAFREFGDSAVVNAARHVVFRATLDPDNHPDRAGFDPRKLDDPSQLDHPERIPAPNRMTFDGRKREYHEGLFVDRGADLQTIATTTKDLFAVQDGFAVNDAGAVAFRASQREKHTALLLAAGGATVVLAESGRQFQSFELPAIDVRGRVAFVAHTADGVGAVCRATQAGGLPEIVADAQSGFVGFGAGVSVDDGGRIAFVGRRADGREALFLASKYTDVKELLAIGDPAGRYVVKHLRLGNHAFGRADRLVLLAQLEPDLEAIVLLHLPPGR